MIQKVRQIHIVLFLLLNIFSVYCFLYVGYQMTYYHGDGFGNLPADAPTFMRTVKHVSCEVVMGSLVVAVVWLPFALLATKHATTIWRRILFSSMTLTTALLYAFSFAILGFSIICW